MPPSNCTSKWRMRMTRLEPSRTTANASGRRASRLSPLFTRSRNSSVLARSASSDNFSYSGSIALMRSTVLRYRRRSRSLRLPKILVRKLVAMKTRPFCLLCAMTERPKSLKQCWIQVEPTFWIASVRATTHQARIPAQERDSTFWPLLRRDSATPVCQRGAGPRSSPQKAVRILGNALHQQLEVQVGPGGAPRGAHFGNALTPLDQIALVNKHLRSMGIAGDQVVSVIDLDHLPILGVVGLGDHHTTGGGQDRSAHISLVVLACVQGRTARDRIDAPAEARTQWTPRHGGLGGHHHLADLLVEQPGFNHRHEVNPLVGNALEIIERRLQFFKGHGACGHQSTTSTRRRLQVCVHTGKTGHPLPQGFQLHHPGLHFTDPSGHDVQVLAQVAVTLLVLILHNQLDH